MESSCGSSGPGSVSHGIRQNQFGSETEGGYSAHRIGQKKEVRVLRLISSGTVEELVLARAQRKLEIDGKVIQAGKFDEVTTGAEYEEYLVSCRVPLPTTRMLQLI